jgi:hypothetical protein
MLLRPRQTADLSLVFLTGAGWNIGDSPVAVIASAAAQMTHGRLHDAESPVAWEP